MLKILITGADSYIGDSFRNYISENFDNVITHTLDMQDSVWKLQSFCGYNSVFHVAGIAHSETGSISPELDAYYKKINTDLAIETAAKAKADGVEQFIFMSSCIVYGDSAHIGKSKMIDENTPLAPSNAYGKSKADAEDGLLKLESNNFKIVIIRSPMIYGKNSKGNYPTLSKLALKLPIFPLVKNQRSMLYIENLCEFVRLMVVNGEQGIFWPQNDEYSKTSELIYMIAEAHNKKILLIRGFTWALKLLGLFTPLANKAFGNITYDKRISKYKEPYIIKGLKESIEITEK